MDFMKYTWLWFTISLLLILPGLIGLATWGLQIGIDFRGGTLIELQFEELGVRNEESGTVHETIRTALQDVGLQSLLVQPAGEGSVFLRSEPVNEEQHQTILETIRGAVGEFDEVRFETVGPTISQDLTRKAILAVVIASLTIICYIAFAFRGLPKPASSWRFGLTAIAALLHDLLFVVGAFAILGHFIGYEVDALFITALLTVMGFSVHDTIVVFDRIRENLKRFPALSFRDNANLSLSQTLGRSLATSLTVIFVLLTLFLLGGETIKPFIAALLLGITIGTYSSIFNATPLVALWHRR
ncbi:protein translocase subunit SecF [Candidatus Berkelbacteria bacterium]|nr:protein translocase subunit SecF [Candidatus Berkelbacteria bacterium]